MHMIARIARTLALLLAASATAVAFGASATFTTTADLCMGSGAPYRYNNEGSEYWFPIGDWGFDCRTILRFDVRSLGGLPNLQVQSITLKLFSTGFNDHTQQSSLDDVAPLHPQIHAITAANRDWVEGPGTGYDFVPFQSCYVAKRIGADASSVVAPWAGSAGLTTAGVDYSPAILATRSLTRSDLQTPGAEIDFTFTGGQSQLTDLVNTWLSDNYILSRDNPGLVIFDQTADHSRRANFYSRQCASPPWPDVATVPIGYAPQLVINYSSVPEPGAFSLMAIGAIATFAYSRRKRYDGGIYG